MKAEQHNWPLLAYPKKLKLPTDLYRAQSSNLDANFKQTQSFLSEHQREMIKAHVSKSSKASRVYKSKANEDEGVNVTPKKRVKKNGSDVAKKKSRRADDATTPTSERRASARQKKAVVYANSSTDHSDIDSEELDESDDDD